MKRSGNMPLMTPRHKRVWAKDLKLILKRITFEFVDWIELARTVLMFGSQLAHSIREDFLNQLNFY
jgi:hypothetical protein